MWSGRRWLRDLKWWILHRTTHRYHVVRCDGLKPGYYDQDTRLLHSMFGLLREYVEVECAGMEKILCDGVATPRELGMKRLDWEIGLVWDESSGSALGDEGYSQPTGQAMAAKETKVLYLWWVDERLKRLEPMDESGASAACDRAFPGSHKFDTFMSQLNNRESRTPEYQEWSRLCEVSRQLEERNDAEDAAMMEAAD